MPIGQVVRSHSDIYYVRVDGADVACKPRGKFRLEDLRPLAGDWVEVTLAGEGQGRIDRVLPRKNELVRPPVANVDLCVVVFTLKEPDQDLRFLDRVLAHAAQEQVPCVIALNKVDLYTPDEVAAFQETYGQRVGYPVVPISAREGTGLDRLRQHLVGRTAVLAGHSGVGKSQLVTALTGRTDVRVGELSAKLRRGKHTTRHVELIPLPEGGAIADAPGFTYLEFPDLEPRDMPRLFIEFARYAPDCRFPDCLHRAEPDCAVKAAVEAGEIPRHRYHHYLDFLAEVEARRKW